MLVVEVERRVAAGIGRDVPEVADVPLGGIMASVLLRGWVVMAARGHAILGPDAKFVDVEAMLAGRQAADVGVDVDHLALCREGDPSLRFVSLGRLQDRDGLADRWTLHVA